MIYGVAMMANKLPLVFVLAICLLPARGYICNNNTSLPRDDFEAHGCFCGTETVAIHNPYLHLFFTYESAFAGCHEPEGDVTIECAFLESEAAILKHRFNRTPLSEIPVIDGTIYEDVTCLLLSGNSISSITHQQMKQFPKLKGIFLEGNAQIQIEPNAFVSNPNLVYMDLKRTGITKFPNITGATKLEALYFGDNSIEVIPNISGLTALERLELQRNQIWELVPAHFRGLSEVHTIHLQNNKIGVLENFVFQDMQKLSRLKLQHNNIHRIEGRAFSGTAISDLHLQNNKIGVLENFVFQDMQKLSRLKLQHNNIHRIEGRAFSGTAISDLELNGNRFPELPTSDLQQLKFLNVDGVRSLINFPRAYDENNKPTFPSIQNLTLEYATHCCWYKDYYQHTLQVIIDFGRRRRQSTPTYYPTDNLVNCTPRPDAFHPCYDIIQFTYLRVAIWFTITAAMCGNVLVIIVLIFSMIKKSVTVPQILITNLAAADFCLAVYLTFIAAADLDTAGQYANEAFNWERSAACKTAGFFAVFSSVASICLLALITFERMTTIAFSYTGKRFMTIPRTVVALVIVWSIAFTFGILPAVGVSNYGKVCICLPFEASTSLDKGYIISLLLFTGIVCFFILICYVILFIRVKKTTSSLSGRQELRIAFKMSALVFTDFLIWTPIAIIGLTGVLRGESLIGVQESKYLMIFIFPINCWVNPLLYSILQNAFRNQLCDMFAYCGLCKEYHQRRKAKAQGLTYNAPTDGRRFRLSSITSTSTYTSFLNLLNKRSSVTSIGSNEATQMQNLMKKKHRSHSSTSSDQPSMKEGRFLTPIHESPAPENRELGTQETEADMVFYSDTSHPVNDSSKTQLLSKNSSVVLAEDSSDSGVAQDSDITLNGSPPNNTSNDQPIVFNVSFSPDEESTEC